MSSHVVRNGIDAWVRSTQPSLNTGSGSWLRCQAPGTATEYSYLWLKSPVPHGATVLSAQLILLEIGDFGGSVTINVERINARWVESQIDYNNRPGVTGAVATLTQVGSADGQEWSVDVSSIVQTWANGAAVYGFRIATTSTTEVRFGSLNSSTHRPVLDVTWSDVPDAPTELVPGGGSAVSIAKPTLTYQYHDPNGSDLTAQQIHIKATNTGWTAAGGFASPDFDTGNLGTDDPELDMSTTAWGGIANGASDYWTVRVENAAGLWSEWSDPVRFVRNNHVSVVINNPADVPNNFVSDTTPELAWTVTPASQVARRIIILDDNDPTADPLLDTGRIHTTATTYTPPEGVIDDENITYRLILRTHDDDTRTKTPNDQIYVENVRVFTFVDDPTPNAVTGLTAVQVANGAPHVQLDWSRTTFPDAYVIFRNGKRVATVDPADVFVSGTSFRYVDRTAPPNHTLVYKVRCRVGGVLSQSPTATITIKVGEIWLADWTNPASSRLLAINVALSDLTFDMPEVAAVFTPINGKRAVRIVQGQHGLEGHIEGRIVDRTGLTAANQVGDMLWFKQHPETDLRMTIGDQNLRVVIGNIVLSPLATGRMSERHVTYDFWSLSGPTQ